jgi:hypothetical protein
MWLKNSSELGISVIYVLGSFLGWEAQCVDYSCQRQKTNMQEKDKLKTLQKKGVWTLISEQIQTEHITRDIPFVDLSAFPLTNCGVGIDHLDTFGSC